MSMILSRGRLGIGWGSRRRRVPGVRMRRVRVGPLVSVSSAAFLAGRAVDRFAGLGFAGGALSAASAAGSFAPAVAADDGLRRLRRRVPLLDCCCEDVLASWEAGSASGDASAASDASVVAADPPPLAAAGFLVRPRPPRRPRLRFGPVDGVAAPSPFGAS